MYSSVVLCTNVPYDNTQYSVTKLELQIAEEEGGGKGARVRYVTGEINGLCAVRCAVLQVGYIWVGHVYVRKRMARSRGNVCTLRPF